MFAVVCENKALVCVQILFYLRERSYKADLVCVQILFHLRERSYEAGIWTYVLLFSVSRASAASRCRFELTGTTAARDCDVVARGNDRFRFVGIFRAFVGRMVFEWSIRRYRIVRVGMIFCGFELFE